LLHLIGSSATARVHKVRCRRILLARKSMKCHVKLKLDDAINEVEHLQKLRHAHIVQLVGSYVQGKTFAILLYPVADYDLSTFMERVTQALASNPIGFWDYLAILSFGDFFGCLANALEFIHDNTIKHMDIKPGNILVKEHERYENRHHVYIADFGISRSFSQLDHSQTDSEITKTPRYCAPEVYYSRKWGRSADVFSMGCVFLEMHTVLCGKTLDDFVDYRYRGGMDGSFHANLPKVHEWADSLQKSNPYLTSVKQDTPLTAVEGNSYVIRIILDMLVLDPEKRPKAKTLAGIFGSSRCCIAGPENLIAEGAVKYSNHSYSDSYHFLFCSQKPAYFYVMQKAASNGHGDVVRLLLEKGGSATGNYDGQTALGSAASNGHELVVKLLLEKGANVEAENKFGRTALQCAVSNGHESIVKLLLEKGANVEVKNKFGQTVLQCAASNGHESIVKLLLEKGANSKHGGTALKYTAKKGDQDTVESEVAI
jgi:serine/threonine protein kinase